MEFEKTARRSMPEDYKLRETSSPQTVGLYYRNSLLFAAKDAGQGPSAVETRQAMKTATFWHAEVRNLSRREIRLATAGDPAWSKVAEERREAEAGYEAALRQAMGLTRSGVGVA